MNAQFLKDSYDIVKAKLKEKYPTLTNNDLAYISGQEEEVFDRAEGRTGIKRDEIVRTIERELDAAAAE